MDSTSLNKRGPKNIPVDIRFGESQYPMMCSACERMNKYGFWVILNNQATLICIKCTAGAVVKIQDAHPEEKLFEVDVNVDTKEFDEAAKAIRGVLPHLSESQALDAAKAALYAI